MIRERACLASLTVALCALLGARAQAQAGEEPPDTRAVALEAEVEADTEADGDVSTDAEASVTVAVPETAAVDARDREVGVEPEVTTAGHEEDSALAAQLRARNDIAAIHRAFGIATWASMAVTAVFGWIQFGDEYGFHDDASQTACANGTAVFQDFCSPNVPWAHAILGFTTTALYVTTAGISFAMPAPLEASADVELHKTLRWFHMATMLATAAFGLVTANLDIDDFGTRQALAITHQALGVTTFGLLTAAAAVVVF